ncbi:SLBB domain-containing protein [Flocculibacter collagenilyticus]|uniref:SLBB domain-containing protein n=1 Tax=Flocculibacter collagenilyticus TaxID=2744479 RepID=UPI001F23A32A|nr:SLBB domain-containing protein [Flocculibacter collagenilyticus]
MSVRIIYIFLLVVVSFTVSAVTPTPAQIEQFKNLPPSQQKMLAKQLGIDISQFKKASQSQSYENTIMPPAERASKEEFSELEETLEEKYLKDKVEVKPFGYDLFANEPYSFQPENNQVAVPDDYIVGVGDNFLVNTYGKEGNTYELMVNRDGMLHFPDFAPLNVMGLTFQEAKQAIHNHISSQTIGLKASVTMGELRSIRIFVMGEAYKPGVYTISSLSTVTNALFASGGLSDIGSLRNIQVKRAGKLVGKVDLYDFLIHGDNSKDVILKSGDVVFIPPVGSTATIKGEVKRPAIYELVESETIKDLLTMAGGAKSSAFLKESVLERFNTSNYKTLINLDLSKEGVFEEPVKDGDVLRINATSDEFKDSVLLIGAVTRPGAYQWHQGMKVSDIIESFHSDLLKIADLEYALIVRETSKLGDIETRQISLANALENKNATDNILLNSNDKVIVFSKYEKRDIEQRTLARLAHTQEELAILEREQLIKEYYSKEFKRDLGLLKDEEFKNEANMQFNSQLSNQELNRRDLQLAQTDLLELSKPFAELEKEEDEEENLEEFSLYSRKLLLAPVILKLQNQASVGQPMELVEVVGEVKVPGVYPLSKGAKINDLVMAAGGLNESAYLERAELTRVNKQGSKASIKHITFKLGDAMSLDESSNIKLTSKDRLNISPIPEWQEDVTITLKGEVLFPGVYTIRRGETLVEVIKRAGGFTDFASADAAVFTRESLKEQEFEQIKKLLSDLRKEVATKSLQPSKATSSISYSESRQLLYDLSQVTPVGRLIIDVPRLMLGQTDYDIQLEDGDTLYVPTKKQSVNVIGEVNVATAHMHEDEYDLYEYIQKSGGFKSRADEDRIYIIKADGSVEVPSGNSWYAINAKTTQIQPGDTIVVPLDSEYMDNLTLWSTATQIIYQVGVALAAISSIN